MAEAGDRLSRAQEVAEHVRRAAEELSAAAEEIPGCDCAVLDSERMAKVVGDLARAELAAQAVHSGLRGLERKHDGTAVGLATLATQPLDGIVNSPVRAQAAEAISSMAAEAASEQTGGQC